MRSAAIIAAKALALVVLSTAAAGAAEVKVLASTAIKTALEELAPQFEKATEHKLTITYGASARLLPERLKTRPLTSPWVGDGAALKES